MSKHEKNQTKNLSIHQVANLLNALRYYQNGCNYDVHSTVNKDRIVFTTSDYETVNCILVTLVESDIIKEHGATGLCVDDNDEDGRPAVDLIELDRPDVDIVWLKDKGLLFIEPNCLDQKALIKRIKNLSEINPEWIYKPVLCKTYDLSRYFDPSDKNSIDNNVLVKALEEAKAPTPPTADKALKSGVLSAYHKKLTSRRDRLKKAVKETRFVDLVGEDVADTVIFDATSFHLDSIVPRRKLSP